MSNKRRNSSSPECETPVKRQLTDSANIEPDYDAPPYDDSDETDTEERPQVHAFTGQTGAFPGLSAQNDEPFYGPAADGIDYLRMVRSEAKGIPGLLVAQSTNNDLVEEDGLEEDGGYWEEDAYIAAPREKKPDPASGLPPAQLRYYEVLLVYYDLVRATMKCVPPLSAIERLTSSQPISFPSESRNARYTWGQCLKTRNPSPTQIACMDEISIFELVRLVTKKMRGLFEKDDIESAKRIGAWTWAILGKCPDRGGMASEEISMLRELARKALDVRRWIMQKSRPAQATQEDVDEDDEEEDEDGDVEEGAPDAGDKSEIDLDIQAARSRLAADPAQSENKDRNGHSNEHNGIHNDHLEAQAAKREKLVALDMILTVVGEVYGQRDLLEYRTIWEQDPIQV